MLRDPDFGREPCALLLDSSVAADGGLRSFEHTPDMCFFGLLRLAAQIVL